MIGWVNIWLIAIGDDSAILKIIGIMFPFGLCCLNY